MRTDANKDYHKAFMKYKNRRIDLSNKACGLSFKELMKELSK